MSIYQTIIQIENQGNSITDMTVISGNLSGDYYPVTNPSGYITNAALSNLMTSGQALTFLMTITGFIASTGNLISQFIPTTQMTGIMSVTGFINATGNLIGQFLPISSGNLIQSQLNLINSGTGLFITGIPTGNFITNSQTGQFQAFGNYATTTQLAANGQLLLNLISGTGNFTGLFYPISSNPSGYLQNGALSPYLLISNTGGFYDKNNISGFITGFNSGQYITSGQTGIFATTGQLNNYYLVSNPSGYINSSSLSGFITSGQTGAFASFSQQQINISGIAALQLSQYPIMTSNSTSTVSYNISGFNETVYNLSASLLGTLTINLPSMTNVGQIIRYVSQGAATILAINGGVKISPILTSLAANTTLAWQALSLTGSYARIT